MNVHLPWCRHQVNDHHIKDFALLNSAVIPAVNIIFKTLYRRARCQLTLPNISDSGAGSKLFVSPENTEDTIILTTMSCERLRAGVTMRRIRPIAARSMPADKSKSAWKGTYHLSPDKPYTLCRSTYLKRKRNEVGDNERTIVIYPLLILTPNLVEDVSPIICLCWWGYTRNIAISRIEYSTAPPPPHDTMALLRQILLSPWTSAHGGVGDPPDLQTIFSADALNILAEQVLAQSVTGRM